MKKQMMGLFALACCGALFAGGCAKQGVVKKDQGITPIAKPAAVAPEVKKQVAAKPSEAVESKAVEQKAADAEITDAQRAAALQSGLEKIYFNFDSSKLSKDARNTLVKDGDVLKKAQKAKVRVEGNCDERGSDEYNLALGEKRAKEAAQYLVSLGIAAEQISTISYGKEKPVATGHDEASWAKNRRDDFVVVR